MRPRRFEGSPDARLSRASTAALFILLVAGAYASPLFFRRNFVGRDLLVYNLPLEKAVHDAWARGTLPIWNPDASGGRPLLPNPNSGAFYPVRPALATLPFPLAMRIYPILHWALAGIGIILLLRNLSVSAGAALVAASTYSFSGVMVSEIYYSNFQPGVTLLPWSLWALLRPSASRARKILVLSLVYALLMLAGDVFTTGIAVGSALLWILTETARESRRRAVAELATAVALAVLLAAPQIVATALLVPETHRGVLGLKLAEVFAFSVPPWRLLELAVPYLFGETWSNHVPAIWAVRSYRFLFATLYCGAFALIAVLSLARRAGDASGAKFARLLALAALLLAVPGSLAPKAILDWPSPFPLRYPEKFCVALAFALAVAAGVALERYRSSGAPRWLLAPAALLAGAALACALWPQASGRLAAAAVRAGPDAAGVAARELSFAFAEGGIYWTATLLALEGLRRGGVARAAALAALVLVPVAANRKIARVESEDAVFAPTPFARAIARRDPHGQYRALDESSYRPPSEIELAARSSDPGASDYSRRVWYLHTQSLWGRGTVFNSDLDVGDLSRVDSLRRYSSVAATLSSAPAFFGSFALAFGIRWKDQEPVAGYRPFGKDGLQVWDDNALAVPDIRLLRNWREEAGALEALAALPTIGPGEAVVESGRRGTGTARAGELRVLEKSPNRLRLRLRAPDPTWLFVVRGYWNHRTVLLDGDEIAPVPAQIALTAVPVPAGEHDLDWRERVPGGSVSWAGPAIFALLAAWLLARESAARRAA